MKTTTIFAGLFAATAFANPTFNAKYNATVELAERFKADDAFKAAIQNTDLTALAASLPDTCSKATVNTTGSVTAGDVNAADIPEGKPQTLEEVLLWIWCGQCREKYQKCMNSWACWINPEACAITCQCDTIREQPDCKACGYKC